MYILWNNLAIRAISACLFWALYALAPASAEAFDAAAVLERCAGVESAVRAMLESEGVSGEYFYLMAAESRCKPSAVSKAGARGYWQLMPYTARVYGCTDMADLMQATRAAARYLRHLGARGEGEPEARIIYSYSMGGRNFRRAGRPSSEAKGLYSAVKQLIKASKKGE